jgi:predicted DNA-binding WGR domain protein
MKNETANPWESLHDRIAHYYPNYRYVAKPTLQDLDAFEAASGFLLPRSYRDFALAFGPGELAQQFKIYTPGAFSKRNEQNGLAHFNESYRTWKKHFAGSPSLTEQAKRMIVFSTTVGGDSIGWDPEDVCDTVNHEYGIFNITRHNDVERIGNSFEKFILDYCLGMGYFRFWGLKEEWVIDGDQQCFNPASDLEPVPKAKRPAARKPSSARRKGSREEDKTLTGKRDPASKSTRRRFEFSDGTSDKFWEIEHHGSTVTVCFGRRGSSGQTKSKTFSSAEAAAKHVEKLIREKSEKWYHEVE